MKEYIKNHPQRCITAINGLLGLTGAYVSSRFGWNIEPEIALGMSATAIIQTFFNVAKGK